MELCQFTPFLSLSLNLLIKTQLGLHCLLYLYLIKKEIKQDLTVLSQEMNSAVWHLHFRIHLAIQFLFCLTVLLFYKRHLRWRHVYMFRPCEGLSTGSNDQCMYFIFFFLMCLIYRVEHEKKILDTDVLQSSVNLCLFFTWKNSQKQCQNETVLAARIINIHTVSAEAFL